MSKNEDDLRAYRLPAASLCYEYHPKTPEGIYCL